MNQDANLKTMKANQARARRQARIQSLLSTLSDPDRLSVVIKSELTEVQAALKGQKDKPNAPMGHLLAVLTGALRLAGLVCHRTRNRGLLGPTIEQALKDNGHTDYLELVFVGTDQDREGRKE